MKDYVDRALIAVPGTAYHGMIPGDAISRYMKMSGEDFNKQFESSEEPILNPKLITVTLNNKKRKIVRTVAPFTKFDKWKGKDGKRKDAKGSLMGSLIYTEANGYPIGEYIAIRNKNPFEIGIGRDTAVYFLEHNWEIEMSISDSIPIPDFTKKGNKPLLDVRKPVFSKIRKMTK